MSWTKAEANVHDERLIVAAWGPPKVGKTHFALTFPEPIYFHNFDWGIEHHLPKNKGREIYVANYLTEQPNLGANEATAMLRSFERDYAAALSKGKGTIVIDTSTQLWQLTSKVFLETIKATRRDGKIYPFDYADANTYFQNLINQVKRTEMSMVVIQRAATKYDERGQETSEIKQQGNNQVPYLVQLQVRLTKEKDKHLGTIEESWDAGEFEGVVLTDPSYDKLIKMLRSQDERSAA